MLIISKNMDILVFSEKITAIEVCNEEDLFGKIAEKYIIKAHAPGINVTLAAYDTKEEALLNLNNLRTALVDGIKKSIILN